MQTKIAIIIAALFQGLALGAATPQGSLSCAPPPTPADCSAAVNSIKEYPQHSSQPYTFGSCTVMGTSSVTDPAQQDLTAFTAAARAAVAAILGCGNQAGVYTSGSFTFSITPKNGS